MMWRPTREEMDAARGKTVPDLIEPGLSVLFCGINPGLYTAVVGHHFARPGNRFWRALYQAGFTDRLLVASEEHLLLDYGCGITNLVQRATGSAAELSKEELEKGGQQLVHKVRRYQPEYLAVLGIGAFRSAFGDARATMGPQSERLEKAKVWVLPNPSGLNAHFTPPQLATLFAELRNTAFRERHPRN